MTATYSGLPCELCGAESDCTCPPCPCKWCRDRRGDPVTPLERAAIDRHVEALRLADERKANRASAARMRSNIERLLSLSADEETEQ